jgi:hypothetical protein
MEQLRKALGEQKAGLSLEPYRVKVARSSCIKMESTLKGARKVVTFLLVSMHGEDPFGAWAQRLDKIHELAPVAVSGEPFYCVYRHVDLG